MLAVHVSCVQYMYRWSLAMHLILPPSRSELRCVALPLVNAFGIPDHILRAPIGLANTGASDVYKEYLLAAGFE